MQGDRTESEPIVLDITKLLGFSQCVAALAADERISLVELSRLLSKVGAEAPR